MNKAILIGRLTNDITLKTTANGVQVCSFTLAVDRRFKNQSGERETDFIQCVAWRKTAEFIANFFGKGSRIAVCGAIQTRTWDDEQGTRHYVTEVIIDEAYFCDSKKAVSEATATAKDIGQEAVDPYADAATALPFDL